MSEIHSRGILLEKKIKNNLGSPMVQTLAKLRVVQSFPANKLKAPSSPNAKEELNPFQPTSKGTEVVQISVSKQPLSNHDESTKNKHISLVNAEGTGARGTDVSVMRPKIMERDLGPSPSEKPSSKSNPSIALENSDRNDTLVYTDQSAQGYSSMQRISSFLPSSLDNQKLTGKDESSEQGSAFDTEESIGSGEKGWDKPRSGMDAVAQDHDLSNDVEFLGAVPQIATSSKDAVRSASGLSSDRQVPLLMPETKKNLDASINKDSIKQRPYQEVAGEFASLNLGSRNNSLSDIPIKPDSELTSSKTLQKRNSRTVKKGDTLMEIALEFSPGNPEDALRTILRLNPNITDMDRIYPGQVIMLSTLNAADQNALTMPEGLHYSRYGTYESWQALEQVVALLTKKNIKYLIVNTPNSVGGSTNEVIIGGYETDDALKAVLGQLDNN